MTKNDVTDKNKAYAYLVDCTLATVSHMATLKSKSKSEFKRQISIAQTAINFANEFGIPLEGTRADEIRTTVKDWAELIEKHMS